MKKLIEVLQKHRPEVPLNLEMITRDPLKVPCLTGKFWATFETLPGRQLAESLARVRKHAAKNLPQLSALPRARQIEIEEQNVGKCLHYARQRLGL